MSKISENNIIEIKEIFKLISVSKNSVRLKEILNDIIKVADMVIEFKDYMGDDNGMTYTTPSDGERSSDSDSDYEPESFEKQLIGQSNSLTL